MKSFFDSIYHFQYVLFFIQWTLTLSLALGACMAVDKAYFGTDCTFYLVFMTQIPAPYLPEHSRKTIEMIKFRPKTEEELKQPSTPAADKAVTAKPADPKKRANDGTRRGSPGKRRERRAGGERIPSAEVTICDVLGNIAIPLSGDCWSCLPKMNFDGFDADIPIGRIFLVPRPRFKGLWRGSNAGAKPLLHRKVTPHPPIWNAAIEALYEELRALRPDRSVT